MCPSTNQSLFTKTRGRSAQDHRLVIAGLEHSSPRCTCLVSVRTLAPEKACAGHALHRMSIRLCVFQSTCPFRIFLIGDSLLSLQRRRAKVLFSWVVHDWPPARSRRSANACRVEGRAAASSVWACHPAMQASQLQGQGDGRGSARLPDHLPPREPACKTTSLSGLVLCLVFFSPFFLECPGRLHRGTLLSTSPRSALCAAAEQVP